MGFIIDTDTDTWLFAISQLGLCALVIAAYCDIKKHIAEMARQQSAQSPEPSQPEEDAPCLATRP